MASTLIQYNRPAPGGKVINGFVAAGNGEAAYKGDGVEATVGDAEAPDEVIDILDVFLMGFGGKYNHGEPAGEARECADPPRVKKGCQLVGDNFGFMDSIAGRAAGNRVCGAGVDAKFVVEDGSRCSTCSERVPATVDDVS